VPIRRVTFAGLVLVIAVASGGCWIQPGFGPSRQGYTPFDGGTTRANVVELDVAWRRTVGSFSTRPIVVGPRVVVTARNHIEALDIADGSVLWEHTHTDLVDPSYEPTLQDPTWRYDGTVHVPISVFRFGGEFRYAIDTGEFTGGITGGLSGPVALTAPAVRPDATAIVVGAFSPAGTLIELNYNGRRGLISFSTFPTGSPPITDAMLEGRRAYVGAGSDLLEFELDACNPIPQPFPPGYCFPSRTLHFGGTVRTPAGTDQAQVATHRASGVLNVYDPVSRNLTWSATTETDLAAPLASPGRITVGGADGMVRSYRSIGCGSATCTPRWTGDAGAAITTQPVSSGGVIYVGTAAGTVVAFGALGCGSPTCAPIWVGDANAAGAAPNAVRAGPILSEGRVFVTLESGELVAFAHQ